MPSAFQLFGEIDVNTQAFKTDIRSADIELKRFGKSMTDTESKAKSLNTALNKAVKADPAMKAALADIAKMQARTAKGEMDLTALITKQAEAQTRIKMAAYRRQTEGVLAEIRKQQAAERKASRVGSGFGSSFAGGLGVPLGVASVGAIAGAGIATGIGSSINAARDAANAQIQLESAAKETGIAYSELTKQANAFGNATALSNAKAQSTFAQLVNFANAAGRSNKLEEFRIRFADLAAAKGINANQLGDISRQLNALTDEATDKLLNANPSAFYADFAKSIGKTADSLSGAEQRAAVFDAVLKKGAIFDGAASARAKTLAGDIDSLKKNIDDVTASLGKALGPLASFIALSAKTAVGGNTPGAAPDRFWVGLSELFRPSNRGKENQGITSDLFGEENYLAEQAAKRAQEAVKAAYEAAKGQIDTAASSPEGNLLNFAFSKFVDSKAFINSGEAERGKITKAALEKANDYIAAEKKGIEQAFKGVRTGLTTGGQLDDRFNAFTRIRSLLSPSDAEELGAKFSDAYTAGFKRTFENSKGKVNFQDLIGKISKDSALQPNDRSDLLKMINADIDQGKEKVKELGKTYQETLNELFAKANTENPFVKLAIDANEELSKLRQNTRGLSADLRAAFAQKLAQTNAANVFKAQLATGLESIDLRHRAADLRNPINAKKIEELIMRSNRNFIQDNPNYLNLKRQEYEGRQRDTNDPLSFNGQSFDDFIKEDLKNLSARTNRAFRDQDAAARERLSEQIAFINKPGLTGDQRFLADAQLAGLAGRPEASELAANQREILASALERQAASKAELDLKSLKELQKLGTLTEKVVDGIAALNQKGKYRRQASDRIDR